MKTPNTSTHEWRITVRERVTKKGYRTRERREVSLVQLVTPRRGQHRTREILIRHQPNAQMVRGTHFQRRATNDEDAGARRRNVHLSRFRSKRRHVSREVFRQLRRESIIERREERGRRQVVVAKKCRVDRTRFLLE